MHAADLARGGAFAAWLVLACASPPALPTQNELTTAAWCDRAIDRSADVIIHVDLSAPTAQGPLRNAIIDQLLAVVASTLDNGPDLHRPVEAASEMILAAPIAGDPVVILRDVPLTLDPRAIPSIDGSTQFRLRSVEEYVEYNYTPATGLLFVLRDGTWILSAGRSAQTLKNAIVTAGGAPVLPKREPGPLATVYFPGAALHAIAAKERLKLLAPVFVRASSLDATLSNDAVAELHLHYGTEAESLESHALLVDVARAYARQGSWLGAAKLSRESTTVSATVTIPPEALTHFGDAY
ncbi:hypothetical protein BH09MYX1_BH09MYX1_43910 [soil metagenome]